MSQIYYIEGKLQGEAWERLEPDWPTRAAAERTLIMWQIIAASTTQFRVAGVRKR